MKLKDLSPGHKVKVDSGFTCMTEGLKTVLADEDGALYVACSDGRHYLDGQIGPDKELVGISPST